MKITHYITFNTGSGPISLVSFHMAGGEKMIRITHDARYDRVIEVSAAQAREAVAKSPDLGMASTAVPAEHAAAIARDTLGFAASLGCREQALRWGEGGQALLFENEDAARGWDSHHDEEHGALTRRRARVMMD